ncbi:hypothetical protein C8035_v001022 [Colletotrichum spinosum]|uniref:Uncharacterized protein n=1 Tax=Colletotrichum spinosum TaxID=1347390 RepID=A0A4R8Q125_9PEZI|nr:hypothetical protein C8035_v001022 [Colletotrichum spinosum]
MAKQPTTFQKPRMRHFAQRFPSLRICNLTILVPLIVYGLHVSRTSIDWQAQATHRVLSTYLKRGQLGIELFPPLSYFLDPLFPAGVLHLISYASRHVLVHVMFSRGFQDPTHLKLPRQGWGALLVFYIDSLIQRCGYTTRQGPSSLAASTAMARCLLLYAVTSQGTSHFADHLIVILAGCLGCNTMDWVLCYAVVVGRSITSFVSKIPRASSLGPRPPLSFWIQIESRIILALLRAVMLPPLVLIFVYASLFPTSEVAAGGNYNLHHADGPLRRILSHREPNIADPSGATQYGLDFSRRAVRRQKPLTLYIPEAGFLWGDTPPSEELLAQKNITFDANSANLFFSDPFDMRYTWFLKQAATVEPRSDRFVYLKNNVDRRYLGTAENLTTFDAGGMDVSFSVKLHDKPSDATTWRIDWDDAKEARFRLFNPQKGCYMATDYQTYEAVRMAHTEEPGSILAHGAQCARLASKDASTFWVIEGKFPVSYDRRRTVLNARTTDSFFVGWQDTPSKVTITPTDWFENVRNGLRVAKAHLSLLLSWCQRCQLHVEFAPFGRPPPSYDHGALGIWFERVVLGLFLGIDCITRVANKRGWLDVRGADESWMLTSLALGLCWGHFLMYGVFGLTRPYGGDFVLLFALTGLLRGDKYLGRIILW